MHLEVIDTFEALHNVRRAWTEVYDADPEAQFFMSYQWMGDWLKFRSSTWYVLAVRPSPDSQDYVAFLPLRLRPVFDPKHGFTNKLYLAGTPFSDYAGVLCRPEAEKEALPLLANHIKRQLNWALFKLDNLMMSERRKRLFLKPFDQRKFVNKPLRYVQRSPRLDHGISPVVDLPGSWDDYLAQLSANNRQKIRRLLKKVDGGGQHRITVLEGEDQLKGIDTLLERWREKWLPVKGEERVKDIVGCNRGMLQRCSQKGTLFMPVFWDGDRPVATLATLVDRSKQAMHFLITGRDESFSDLPAGYLLHAFSLRHAIAEGFRTYDFLRGNEPYKYLFGPREMRMNACELHTHDRRNLQGGIDLAFVDKMVPIAKELEDKGEHANAEAAYRAIVEAVPDEALALYRLGRIYARKGEHDMAAAWLKRSVAAQPGGDNAWKWLARSLQALGQSQAALDAWNKVLTFQPQNEEAKRALAELRIATLQAPSPALVGLSPKAPVAPTLPALSIPEGRFSLLEL